MLKAIIKIVLILIIYIGSCYIIYKQEKPKEAFRLPNFNIQEIKEKLDNEVQKETTSDSSIGEIRIDSIKLKEKLYPLGDKRNNVDENVTILKESISPQNNNSIFFLAAHSGTGPYAYFKELDKVKINDIVILLYEDNKYEYIVKDSWETEKDGDIEIKKEESNQLILTTCSPTNKTKQLVINCIKKES